MKTHANDVLRPLHDRMPVMFGGDQAEAWLDPATRAVELAVRAFDPAAAPPRELLPGSTRVNSPQNDDPTCVAQPAT